MGYGFSLGLENTNTLAMLIVKFYPDTKKVFSEFERRVLKRTEVVSTLSRQFTKLFYMTKPENLNDENLNPLYEKFFEQINTTPYQGI